jgi:hypothetical protein
VPEPKQKLLGTGADVTVACTAPAVVVAEILIEDGGQVMFGWGPTATRGPVFAQAGVRHDEYGMRLSADVGVGLGIGVGVGLGGDTIPKE